MSRISQQQVLTYIRSAKSRVNIGAIINAAEARDSKLGNIESDKERGRLWVKVEKLGLKKGDMVFIHTEPRAPFGPRAKLKGGEMPNGGFISNQHRELYGKPLTVRDVKQRSKEVVVRAPGSVKDHVLSPHTCKKLKLSKEPSPEAFANGLKRTTISQSDLLEAAATSFTTREKK